MRNNLLYDYWHGRARDVLRGYRDYERPMLDYDRVSTVAFEPINLLSDKGADTLSRLEGGADFTLDELLSCAHKMSLNLDLFIEPDRESLDSIQVGMDKQMILAGCQPNGEPIRAIVNLNRFAPVSGCPHNCPHCAEFAEKRVVSMPFPIFLKVVAPYKNLAADFLRKEKELIASGAGKSKENYHILFNASMAEKHKRALIETHDDSDPFYYFDPVIGADYGDLTLAAEQMNMELTACARGLLSFGGIAEKAMRKRAARAKRAYVGLSVPLFAADPEFSRESLKCAERAAFVMSQYGDKLFGFKFMSSEKAFEKYKKEIEGLMKKYPPVRSTWNTIEARGRAALLGGDDACLPMPAMGSDFEKELKSSGIIGYFGMNHNFTQNHQIQMDAFGRVCEKNTDIPTEIVRNYMRNDIYGRNVITPDIARQMIREGGTRFR